MIKMEVILFGHQLVMLWQDLDDPRWIPKLTDYHIGIWLRLEIGE